MPIQLRYETRSQPLISRQRFAKRVFSHFFAALAFLLVCLAVGVVGYHGFENMPWIDAMLNASMILGGMGPVDVLHTNGGKLFASFYALFSGVGFLVGSSIMLAPVVHRLLHALSLDESDINNGDDKA